MVGSLQIFKILHCKKISKIMSKKKSTSIQDLSYESSEQNSNPKKDETICRVCSNDGHIPIYGNNTIEDISESFKSIAGIEIEEEDGFPKYLCSSCYTQLQSAIAFRKTAQKTDYNLRNVPIDTTTLNVEEPDEPSDPIEFSYEDENTNGSVEMDEPYEYKAKKPKRERKWRCRRCDMEFKGFEDYQEHRLSDEHENFRQTCPICHKSFMYTSFKNHMKLHGQEKPYMCDFCGKKFRMQGQLSRHRATHLDDLPFQCSLCPYRGRFNECVKMHMRTHTGEKPYQCSQCPARFVNKGNLTRHALIHREERDYKCDACDRGFYTKRELELHLKVDHTGVKDHVCNICGKAFGYRRQMLKHQLKVHKREKLRGGRVPVYMVLDIEKKRKELAGSDS